MARPDPNPFTASDHRHMAHALRLAERGLTTTTPNPRVGCVIVQGDTVVAEGWHQRAGQPHAEAIALRQAGERARGATAYVTLEPCAHHGRTPPCADALIEAGVSRVVSAMLDPNPQVSGRGMQRLADAGIAVEVGLMRGEAEALNIGFISRMTRGRPWVRLKVATTLDGKTALNNGVSQWITGPQARRDGHAWRARACAVLTGFGTVREDNPQLNVRAVPCERQPLKVLIDSRLETPLDARIFDGSPVLIAAAVDDAGRIEAFRTRNADVMVIPNSAGKVDLTELFLALGQRGINEVHVEAGFKLNGSLLRENCVDELLIYQAPLLVGDAAQGAFNLNELVSLDGAMRLDVFDRRMLGDDLRLRARIVRD